MLHVSGQHTISHSQGASSNVVLSSVVPHSTVGPGYYYDVRIIGAITASNPNIALQTGSAPSWHGNAVLKVTNVSTASGYTGGNASPGSSGGGGAGGLGGFGPGNGGGPGFGGNQGGPGTGASPAGAGGVAFNAARRVYLDNGSGTITGGSGGAGAPGGTGGGGGGGGGGGYADPKAGTFTGGRGGDGNTNANQNLFWSGTPAGQGGAGGGVGGGGGSGQPSIPGFWDGGPGGPPGPNGGGVGPGAQGNAITGNANIVYIAPGTINGPVS